MRFAHVESCPYQPGYHSGYCPALRRIHCYGIARIVQRQLLRRKGNARQGAACRAGKGRKADEEKKNAKEKKETKVEKEKEK